MSVSTLERFMPWSGAVAGLAWVAHDPLTHTSPKDAPGEASVLVIHQHMGVNTASQACLVIMGVALIFFAASVRSLLRSGEGGEATSSNVAYGGWIVVVAGISQMLVWGWGLTNGAANNYDDAAVHMLDYVAYFGWAGMGIGIAAAFIATGLGGLRNAVLPRWFAITSIVLGLLAALGDAGIPPGGLVNYLLLPVWLVAAAVIVARRQAVASSSTMQVMSAA
jgi:hypothetical protein